MGLPPIRLLFILIVSINLQGSADKGEFCSVGTNESSQGMSIKDVTTSKNTNSNKPPALLVADNETHGWGSLTLAVQLLLPLALVALIFTKKKIWIYPYPLLDAYISALCPSISQQQRLLKWMSSRIPHMNSLPNKIDQYWQNGSLLCTLINTVVPGACSNPQKHWKKPPTHGQALAYKYLGVTPVLSENEFSKPILTSCSERKFIKYLLSLQDAINKVTIEEDSLKFTSKYVARGMGLVIGEQNRPSTFYVYPNTGSNNIENILVNIKGPYNTFGGHTISSSTITSSENISAFLKTRKDNAREQKKLEYKSVAQKSFFRTVSFDIGPIMNLVTNRKNTGEIPVSVDMEDDRAKVTFMPKFSGIYELLLTSDGQHLQGSPFIIRAMKSSKDVEDILKAKSKSTKSKLERKVLNRSIDFIGEFVNVTDEFDLSKLDSNNNTNKNLKDLSESNKSDDESTYQDSGIFDLNDQCSNRSRQNDLEDIDEDSQFADGSVTDDSNQNSLECKIGDELETVESNISNMIEIARESNEESHKIIIHNYMPDDVKFVTQEIEQQTDPIEDENMEKESFPVTKDCVDSSVIVEDGNNRLEKDIFDNAELQNNQEFENLYNRYINNENETEHKINKTNKDDFVRNMNSTDFEILSNIPQFQKGKKITSSIEKIVEIFEKNQQDKVHVSVAEKTITQKSDFTYASPVSMNIEQEADISEKVPLQDSAHLDGDVQLSSRDERPILRKDSSICLEDEEIYDTNVKEIKSIFEKKSDVKNRRFVSSFKKHNGLQESKKMLAKSLPNLVCESGRDTDGSSYTEDEFLVKFREKRNFWNNLISQNSNRSLNVSSPEINDNNTKLKSKQYENMSQSSNSLNTFCKDSKTHPLNKFKRRKNELCKTGSLDLTKTFEDVSGEENDCKISRVESLYDRIRLFEKDFDTGKHSTLLKRTKERSELREKPGYPEILKPDSLTEVPNTTSTDQIEEDIRFAEIMKERFEMSRRYFCSLESLPVKSNLGRRHSMDSKASGPKEAPLKRGGSLKVLNVVDKFSLDNVYKDVVLSKLKNSSFMGSPNKDAMVETLSSVSSCDNECDKDKNYVEEDDLNLQFFNIKKRLRKRRSIKSIFDVNY